MIKKNTKYWLALIHAPGIGPVRGNKLLTKFNDKAGIDKIVSDFKQAKQ